MSRIYNGIRSYWKKPDAESKGDEGSEDSSSEDVQKLQTKIEELENEKNSSGDFVPREEAADDEAKENEAPVYVSDKKTDELKEEEKPTSLVWRLGSGVYSTTTGAVTGAVGLGVGSVKWVAGKGYDAGSAVIGTTKSVVSKVPVPTLKRKDKKE